MVARKQYLLRIDPALWAEVERWAADDLRSVNSQVEFILREAVRKRRGSGGDHDLPGARALDAPAVEGDVGSSLEIDDGETV